MSESNCEHLVLLVGSNPLPNYIAAMMLRPRTIWLLWTVDGTADVKARLERALREDIPGVRIEAPFLHSAADAQEVRRVCAVLPRNAHLNYTGGTKAMAAHARLAFAEQHGDTSLGDSSASYLDEKAGTLSFDNGVCYELTDAKVGLKLSRLLQLHGVEGKPKSRHPAGPTDDDATALAHYVCARSQTAVELYGRYCDLEPEPAQPASGMGDKPKRVKGMDRLRSDPFAPPEGLRLSCERIPDEGLGATPIEQWQRFLTGGWLELWLASLIRPYGGEVSINVNCFKQGSQRQFEVDVADIRHCRLYLISCTTDATTDRCKAKLFEAAMRGRQMGGDLARTAMVCLLQGSNSQGSYVAQLQQDVQSVWDATNTPRVFGLDDLRAWAGIRQEQNRATLEAWINE